MLRVRTHGAVGIIAAALTIAGCGSQAATKQDVIARGNAICASEIRDVRAVSPATAISSLPALSQYLQQVVPIVRKEIASLQALPRPARDRAELDRFLAAAGRDGAQYRALSAAAARGDRAGVEQALTNLRLSQSAALARRYGLGQCAATVSTAVS
jgi:hypothetical protein